MGDIREPSDLVWAGRGNNPVALMRTSWKTDAIYLGLKGGSAENGHAHLDMGSFVMDAMGVRWAMDLGGQDYSSAEARGLDLWNNKQDSERWRLFRYNNLAHNTLTFNSELQKVDGYAPLVSYDTSQKFLNAIVDLSQVYRDRVVKALRGVVLVNNQYVVVRDEVEMADEPSSIRWTMVTPAEVHLVNAGTAELRQLGKKMLVKVVEPKGVNLTTWSTEPPNDFDEPNPGTTRIGFEITVPANQKVSFTVLLIPVTGDEVPVEDVPAFSSWSR
jgi:hypothetical protein